MKTVSEVIIDGQVVEIKSRPADNVTSGWSVIAFTPHCSVRCTRLHSPLALKCFVEAIISATVGDADVDVDLYEHVTAEVLSLTDLDR